MNPNPYIFREGGSLPRRMGLLRPFNGLIIFV